MTPSQRRSLLMALPVACMVGAGLFVAGLYFVHQQLEMLIDGKSAIGTVIELELGSSTSASGRAASFPIVTFESDSGQAITFRHRTGSHAGDFAVGDPVPVIYHPGEPEKALIDEGFRNWILPLVLLICGLGLALLTALPFCRLLSRRGNH